MGIQLDVEVGAADSDTTGIEDTKDLLNMEAWMAIAYSLTDEWPLVRDAFQEQLIKALQLSDTFLRAIREDTFIDRSQKLVQFVEAVLQGLRQEQVDTVNHGPDHGTLTVLEPKDWTLALWLCDQLRVPPVFATLESIHESAATKAIADTFVKRLHTLLECIGHLLRLQTVDNTLTLHRLIVACAAFTSPKDLWIKHDPQISKSIMTKAQEILATLFQTTPWSTPSASSISFASPADSATVSAPSYNLKVIRIPGSFSDHVIKILEKDIRSCFTHVKANKMVERAQTTISQHQQKMRQTVQTIEDAEGSIATTGTITVTGEKELVSIHPQHGATASSQKIMIAPVVDTPNDEEELWTAMDDESNMDPRQPRRWDKNFPESVPVLEWCTQQQIQDPSRVHEVFMLLVGPILAMMDSVHKRYQIRGLDLLSRFLIQYHGPSMNDRSASKSQRDDQRIWIKIFERTGLDQVLERNLKPLLSPLQAPNTLETPAEVAQSNEQLEALQAAFRAYLTLILVNTEPRDRPVTEADDPHPTSMRGRNVVRGGIDGDTTTTLTIENLFLHGILGRIRGTNLSKEYLSLVFEWMERLIRPVIVFDSILEQLPPSQLDLTRAPDGGASISSTGVIATESVLVFGMGSLTIKYLQSLLEFIFNVLDYQFPSSPATIRLQSLNLAWRASNALHAVMETSKPRIPRYRGKLMASIANCWANSRIFPSESSKLEAAAKTSSYTLDLATAQARLDQSLIRSMQLCISICRSKIVEDTSSGLEMDLQALKNLDPAIFGPLFTSE
ncbi:hypothetical protein BG011_004095 [Mortierella polycephala]|uniref:Uncharacterized protein n=1 Tax=Mortierella polycephala TaxID=41804 RepID=A0A9P6U231_9FUNG|nr:hypothetical protein BG011_004095 [Mortierella polycephala]